MAKPFDLSKFKKISCDNGCATMQHPDGHKITVIMAKLSPKMRKEMEDLPVHKADGGSPYVDPKAAKEMEKGATSSGVKSMGEMWNNIKEGFSHQPAPKPEPKSYADGGGVRIDPNAQPQIPDSMVNPQLAPETPMEQPMPQSAPPQAIDYSKVTSDADAPYGLGKAQAQQIAAQAQGPQATDTPPPAIQPDQGNGMTLPGQPTMAGNIQNAYGLQMKAADEAYNATAQLGRDKAKVYDEQQKKQLEQITSRQVFQDAAFSDIQNLVDDIKNQHVDPNHFLNSQTSGQKVMNALSIFMSGMGSGPNLAAEFLQKQIDRDIDSQKTNITQKNNLLRHNLDIYKSKDEALAVTRAQYNAMYGTMIDKAAATAATPQAAAARDLLKGQLQAQMGQALMSVPPGQGGDLKSYMNRLDIVNPHLAETYRSKFLEEFPHRFADRPITTEERTQIREAKDLDYSLTALSQFVKQHGFQPIGAYKTAGEALATQAQSAAQKKLLGGSFKEGEKGILERLVKENPMTLFADTFVQPSLKVLMQSNQHQLGTIYQSLGYQAPPATAKQFNFTAPKARK